MKTHNFLLILLIFTSCQNFDKGDWNEGINYQLNSKKEIESVFMSNKGKIKYVYEFYENGNILYTMKSEDSFSRYLIYDTAGILLTKMHYTNQLNKSRNNHYFYKSIDNQCGIDIIINSSDSIRCFTKSRDFKVKNNLNLSNYDFLILDCENDSIILQGYKRHEKKWKFIGKL